MGTVLKIFRDDVRSLSRRFFALAIIAAISVLPALYAWVNIYANGNPYANTGGIKIAVASVDPGIDLADGSHVNMADEVADDLKKSDKIGWQFPGSAEEAIKGVESGEYYAAIVFENNFTYNMYHFEQALLDRRAPITYYENAKKNAVASKITETAAQNVQESIKTKYLEMVFGVIFDETNEVAADLADARLVDKTLDQLAALSRTLKDYDRIITNFTSKSGAVHDDIARAEKNLAKARKTASKTASGVDSDLAQARHSLEVLKTVLEEREARIQKEYAELEKIVEKLRKGGLTEEEKAALIKQANERIDRMKADIEGLVAFFPESSRSAAVQQIRTTLLNMIADLNALKSVINDPISAQPIMDALGELTQVSMSSSIDSFIKTMDRTLDLMEPLMSSMSGMLDDIDPVLDSADTTVSALDKSLLQVQKVLRATAGKVDKIIEKVNAVEGDDRLQTLIDLLGGDPEEYARFFSALVEVNVEEVYSVASYGAAMAPFYSVLAIWVGGVILVSILKTHIDRKKYPGVTEAQAFFGRFILFFLIGQAQAAVIVAGDIFLLNCQPVHPWLMWLAAAVASFVFVMLIYALTLSFGDIGKAIVVVIMVLQIAGSSGSYPIEILPVVFGKIYKFFPFPYAINAMREGLCGTYGNDFIGYIAELLIFAMIALAIGLFVRKPFIAMNDFVSEKIEETEVL